MFTITLPDGATKQFEEPLDGLAFAKSIAPSLGKKALALKVDGELTDLSLPLDRDATVEIVNAP